MRSAVPSDRRGARPSEESEEGRRKEPMLLPPPLLLPVVVKGASRGPVAAMSAVVGRCACFIRVGS